MYFSANSSEISKVSFAEAVPSAFAVGASSTTGVASSTFVVVFAVFCSSINPRFFLKNLIASLTSGLTCPLRRLLVSGRERYLLR